MTSPGFMEAQTTKKYDLPLSHLEYSYIDKCSNVKELEKILRVLRSGEEGRFLDLEKFTEKRIETLNPKSRMLRQEGPILKPSDLSSGDWKTIEEDLKSWTNSMHDRDSEKGKTHKGAPDIMEGDENLPPVRSSNVTLEGKKQKPSQTQDPKKKRVMPRDYKEWEKVNIDEELQRIDEKDKSKSAKKSNLNGVSLEIDTTGMTEEEKELKAAREKDKGNEAFRSHDYEESVTYYSRSISLLPTAASYNNRALAYLKLEKWNKAISDCNMVLSRDADNIKALLRRGTAFKSKKDFKKATSDFEKVLVLEPQNKKAETLLDEVKKETDKHEKEKKEKGRRMVIEEVDDGSEEEEEEVETIEVEKPVINGHKEASIESISTERKDLPSPNKQKNTSAQPCTDEKTAANSNNISIEEKDSSNNEKSVPSCDPSSRQPTNQMCSPSVPSDKERQESSLPSALPQSSGMEPVQGSSDTTTYATSTSASQEPSKATFSLGDDSSKSADSPTSREEVPSTDSPQSVFTRPVYVQFPLPSKALTLKEEGNQLFRSGQYGEAIGHYSKAIAAFDNDQDQAVNKSILLSNRAACHLKTGNCNEAVQDCTSSLELVPHSTKSLLRRAAAYETLERHGHAYVDYKHVLSIDSSALQAQQGANRCQSLLQNLHGPKRWREKIPSIIHVLPWEVPDIVDQAGLHKSMSSSVSLSGQEGTTESNPSTVQPTIPSKEISVKEPLQAASHLPQQPAQAVSSSSPQENSFEEMKSKGNQFVQKGNYQEAAVCYSQCILRCPDQVACYTNRALCYLKLNKPSEAETDCDMALSLQSTNPKALYRRALAKKMLHQYKQSLQDFLDLLRIEPKNTAAKKEVEEVKKCYKEELDKLKVKKATEQESKVRKRMKIEEVEDDEEEEKPVRNKSSEKMKTSGKSRGAKSAQLNSGSKCSKAAEKKNTATYSVHSPSMAPPIAPRLMKTTPYEFCQAWNSLKPCQGIQPYAEILRQIAPVDLPQVISNKLDGQMLQIIVRCVYEEMVLKGDVDHGYHILDSLCQVPRFSTVSMFMSSKEKKEVAGVLDILAQTNSGSYNSADILRLKKEYSVK